MASLCAGGLYLMDTRVYVGSLRMPYTYATDLK